MRLSMFFDAKLVFVPFRCSITQYLCWALSQRKGNRTCDNYVCISLSLQTDPAQRQGPANRVSAVRYLSKQHLYFIYIHSDAATRRRLMVKWTYIYTGLLFYASRNTNIDAHRPDAEARARV